MVLIQAAFLSEMTAPQMDFADALLKLWARKVQILKESPETNRGAIDPLVVDLAKPIGARPQPRGAVGATQRVARHRPAVAQHEEAHSRDAERRGHGRRWASRRRRARSIR